MQPPQAQHKSSAFLFMRVQNACWGAFTAGYTMSELGIVFGHLATIFGTPIDDQNHLCTLVVSILSLGALISAFLSHFVMHKVERRTFMMIADIVFLVGSGLTQVTEWYTFALARFVMGLAVGMNTSIMSLYIREISPDNMTGKTGALFQANINLGIIFGFIWNLPLKEAIDSSDPGIAWRWVFLFPALLCLWRLMMFTCVYTTDTPYYYYRNGMNDQGREALELIFKEEHILNIESTLLGPGSVDFTDLSEKDQSEGHGSEEKSYLNRLRVGMAINFLQQMCGNTFLAVFSTTVLNILDLGFDGMRCFVLGSYIFLFFVSTLGVNFNKKLARKRYLVGGFLFCSILQFGLAVVSYLESSDNDSYTLRFLFVLCLFFFYAAYNFSVGPATSIFTSDILKDKGISYSVAMNWLGNIISLVLYLNTHLHINFFVYGVFALIGFLFSMKFVIETRYMNFQEIQLKYNPNIAGTNRLYNQSKSSMHSISSSHSITDY